MIISGNLDETSIVDAFQLIGSSRRTGILRASQKDGEIRIYWKSGSIVYAESGKGDASLQLRIVSALGPERWHRALRESGGTLASATSRLVADGALAADGLKSLAEECSRAAIEELFSWSEGGFEFSEGAFPDADIVPVTLHTPSLIVEGSRRVGRLAELRAAIPDRHVVFRLASLPDESLRSIRLGGEEWATLSLINGHRSVEEICRLAAGDELRTLQALYGLLSAGLIVELERAEDDDSGKLELGRVKYSRILEVYCELHTMLMDRLLEAPPAAVMPPLRQALAKLAKAYPKVWAGITPLPERELPGAQFVGNILKVPAEQRTPLMMQAFGHLLLKETLVLRHVLGDDAAQMAITDLRMLLQRGEKRYPEVSSKILRHLRDVLRQAEQIPSRYKMGFDFFEKHRYDEAIRLWKSVPPSNPQYRAVQDLINQAHQLTAGRSQLRLALERGEHLYSEGRYEEAVDVWKGAVTADADAADTEHETTRKTLVQRLEEMGRVSVLLGEARSLVQERRFDDARSLLDQALGIAPDLPEAVDLLHEVTARADKMATLREQVFEGLELYRTERYGEAIEVFRRVLALDPRHQLAGDHLRFSQDRLAAILESRPQYAAAREASRAGDHFRAVELWEDLLQKAGNDDVANYFLRQEREALQSQRLFHEAMTFYLDKNFVRATELLQRCLEEHPGHAEALHLLEQCKNRLAQLDHAQGLLREASRHFEAGQVPEAQRAVERLLEIDPHSRPARLAQAQLQQAMEDERSTGRFTGSSLVSRVAEERPTATVRVLPDTGPSQLLDEIIAEEAETPTAQIGPSRPGVPLMSAEEDEPPTPDMRDFSREAKKVDEDVTRSFKPRKP